MTLKPMKLSIISRIAAASLAVLGSLPAFADVKLPRLLSDGAILQRDKPLTIWGWADEGEKVSIKFAGKEQSALTKDGRWSVTFPAFKAGGPYELKVTGKNELTRSNILLGDLWLAAGQSNMELPLDRVKYQYPGLIESTKQPNIREFNVPVTYAFKGPLQDYTHGQWKTATPENLATFSAVGFFFMQKLHTENNVPIGLVTIPVGGSPAEAWVSEAVLQKYPHYQQKLQPFKDDAYVQASIVKDKLNSEKWHSDLARMDIGLKNNWHQEKLATDDWKTLQVPGFLKEQGIDFTNGSFWVRKTLNLTASQAAKKATLWLGCIVDGDQVYVNGQLVGQTGYMYPPRIYAVPAGLLKAGENSISIRITSYSGNPGFVKDKRYALLLGEGMLGDEQIDLQGEWKYQIAARAGSMQPTTTLHYLPASLFNAKLAPALPLKIKGVIWYQGESNVGRAAEYQTLMADLIGDWREQFQQNDLPFVYVQLANFLAAVKEPGESGWADLREAQRQLLAVKNTAMAVAVDAGEWNDIHPLDKQTVGERLALGALKVAYGKKSLLASGPVLKKIKSKAGKLELSFTELGKGLTLRGESLGHIALAGADKKFVWAKAEVKREKVIVWAEAEPEPKWVRYAWADNPAGANLYNSAGLPASPFEASVSK